jgi:cytochrome c biogenesis factor
MATYYKYAEQSADSQVNWAEVGKGISDMLKQEVQIREKKKADIDQATREFQNVLQNAPQGQYQDANKFTNDYAHSMMEQQMIDNRLLKNGQMKLQDYTYRRQNYIDGTNTLFELQKLYQDNYKAKMDGIQSGKLQALTGANMASIEGFADFSKSKAIIDPSTGVVNVGIMRPNGLKAK